MPDLSLWNHPSVADIDEPGLEEFDSEYMTPLPLPGEYIVLELSPVAMVKHLHNNELTEAMSKLEKRKYLAIVQQYFEKASYIKPWVMCMVHLIYDEEPPKVPEGAVLADGGDAPFRPTHRDCKGKRRLQEVLIRLRTRLCELPRVNPIRVPRKIFNRFHRIWQFSDPDFRDNVEKECRHYILQMAPRSPLLAFEQDPDDLPEPQELSYRLDRENIRGPKRPAWPDGNAQLRICLMPHCDYSFQVDVPTCPGIMFVEDQAEIVSTMVHIFGTEMPLRTRMPVHPYDADVMTNNLSLFPRGALLRLHMTFERHAPMFGELRQRALRSKEKARAWSLPSFFGGTKSPEALMPPDVRFLMKSSQDPERHMYTILLLAPPGVEVESRETSPENPEVPQTESISQAILQWCSHTKAALAARVLSQQPSYPTPPDDTPYIPFAEWDRLVAEGLADTKEKMEPEEELPHNDPRDSW